MIDRFHAAELVIRDLHPYHIVHRYPPKTAYAHPLELDSAEYRRDPIDPKDPPLSLLDLETVRKGSAEEICHESQEFRRNMGCVV